MYNLCDPTIGWRARLNLLFLICIFSLFGINLYICVFLMCVPILSLFPCQFPKPYDGSRYVVRKRKWSNINRDYCVKVYICKGKELPQNPFANCILVALVVTHTSDKSNLSKLLPFLHYLLLLLREESSHNKLLIFYICKLWLFSPHTEG